MSKCFITKYPVAIDNDNLPRINTMRIKFQRVGNPTSENRSFRFMYPYGTNVTFHYIGNGHFTDSTLTQDLGKEVTKIWDRSPGNIYMSNNEGEVEFDISKVISLQVGNHDNVQPDYSAATNLTCDLNHLKGRIQVTKINIPLANNNVKLDLSSIKDLVKMSYLVISHSTQVTGDIANLANMTSMITLNLMATQVSGDIAQLKTLTKCERISVSSTNVSGDLSVLSPSVLKVGGGSSKSNQKLSWSSSTARSSKTNIPLVITDDNGQGAWDFGNDVDNLLIDEAACTNYSGNSMGKSINVKGNRTSASDNAIQTLQNNGWTVKIS